MVDDENMTFVPVMRIILKTRLIHAFDRQPGFTFKKRIPIEPARTRTWLWPF